MSEVAVTPNGGRTTRRIPRVRRAETTRFRVDDQKGYITAAAAEDGTVGEVTLRMAKQGSTLAGMMDALGVAISLGLQAGAPLDVYISKFSGMRFVPAGRTDDAELPLATSIMDYVARRLAVDSLAPERRMEMGIMTTAERRSLADAEIGWIDLRGLAMSAPQEPHQ
jgi:ribonucleoside-diphosphate reductase alpha chain